MAEALSRSEVESLLSALNPHQTSMVRDAIELASVTGQPVSSSQLARRVVSLFEQFRNSMASATGQMIPETARLKRHMPMRLPFSELRQRIHAQQCLLLVESEQSGGDLLILLESEFAIGLVSCMLGQGTAPTDDDSPRQSLSPLEQRLLLRWLRESLNDVAEPAFWRPIAFEFINAGGDLDAYFAQAPWWCELWELKTEQLRGRIQIAGQWEFFSSLQTEAPMVEETASGIEPDIHEATHDDQSVSESD